MAPASEKSHATPQLTVNLLQQFFSLSGEFWIKTLPSLCRDYLDTRGLDSKRYGTCFGSD